MYDISVLIVVIGTLAVIYNSQILTNCLIKMYSVEYEIINTKINILIDFYRFICENNPIFLHYYDSDNEEYNEEKKEEEKVDDKVKQKFEDKYLDKFKSFSNEFYFNELELEEEQKEYERIKIKTEKKRFDSISQILENLTKINEIEKLCEISKETDKKLTENQDNFGIEKLVEYFDLQDDYEEDPNDIDFEELYMDLIEEKNALNIELKEIKSKTVTNDEFKEMARKTIIKKKLDKFVDNYILENTPMGNIYMRYNNNKGSFEYFSNNTIPYRYLETVGRKYVMTYWCKPIFVDIEEELKKAEIKFDEEIKVKEAYEKRRQEETKPNPKDVVARMKSYNKEIKSQTIMKQPMKNRLANNVLPPQIKANLPNVNQNSEKQLLKENANRYTWEGRLSSFCPLKKIDKKVLDKKLTMSYAEFKRMQEDEKNKKYI